MLQTHIPWLANGYRLRLQQEEKDKTSSVRPDRSDSFALCREDRVESYAVQQLARARPHPRPHPRRPHSAQPRLTTATDRGAGGERGEGPVDHGWAEGWGEEKEEGVEAKSTIWQASKERAGLPCSGRRQGRPVVSRPRSAAPGWPGRSARSRPSSAAGRRPSQPRASPIPPSARASPVPSPYSARPDPRQPPTTPTRPTSALPLHRPAPSRHHVRRRPSSASSLHPRPRPHSPPSRVDPYTVREKRMRALHEAWAQDPRSGLHISSGAGPGPSPHFLDRHARCREQLQPSPYGDLPERPHTSCGVRTGAGDWEEGQEDLLQEQEVVQHEQRDNMSRVQRYIDCHRPQSAPRMRKELEGTYRRSVGVRSRSAHFCNFVHKADLHTRYEAAHSRPGSGSDEGVDSMTSDPTDHDILAQWRKQSRLTGSGTEGRPGSPTSTDGRHVTNGNANDRAAAAASDDDDAMSVGIRRPMPRAGAARAKGKPVVTSDVSVIVNHLVNSEGESIPRPESMEAGQDDMAEDERTKEAEDEGGAKRRVVKTFVTRPPPVPRAKLIPTITIPSSPIPPGDQPVSTRSSVGSSPRKPAKEEPKVTDSSTERSKGRPGSGSRPPSAGRADKTDTKAKRSAVPKKTKKGADRRRKSKAAAMEPAQADASASGPEAASAGDGGPQPATNDLDVTAKVPDLPDLDKSGKDHGRQSKRGERRLINASPGLGEKLQLPPELLELDSSPRHGYDFGGMETALTDNHTTKISMMSWLNSRMALSQQASRFELPMDMKLLEAISPQDYLRKFCVVTSRRLHLYQRIFQKHKDKAGTLNKETLEACLRETLVQTLKENTFSELCDLLDITGDTVVDFKLFSGVAAITERMLYPYYTTEDTLERPEYQRERIETADFGALEWKLHGIKVSDKMKKVLKTIE